MCIPNKPKPHLLCPQPDWLQQHLCQKTFLEPGSSCLCKCLSTCSFLRGDPGPNCHKEYLLNQYWGAARGPLVFLNLGIPLRSDKRPLVLERALSKCYTQSRIPVRFFPCHLAASLTCWDMNLASYCPSLLQIQPNLVQLIPSTRNWALSYASSQCLCFWCRSELCQPSFPPSFIHEETRAEASALYSSGDEACLLLFQSTSSSSLLFTKPIPPLHPHENAARSPGNGLRCHELLKIFTSNAAWWETWLSWLTLDECRDPGSHKAHFSASHFPKRICIWPSFCSRTELRARTFSTFVIQWN